MAPANSAQFTHSVARGISCDLAPAAFTASAGLAWLIRLQVSGTPRAKMPGQESAIPSANVSGVTVPLRSSAVSRPATNSPSYASRVERLESGV